MTIEIDAARLDDAIRRYVAGESAKKLADELGVSRTAFNLRLSRSGIPIRGQADASRLSWSRSKDSPDHRERVERTCRKAWAAAKGRVVPIEDRIRAANTMAGRARRLGKHEREIVAECERIGGKVSWQTPIGPYNVDFAFREQRVAVEVQRQAVRKDRLSTVSLRRERIEHILNAGWHVVVVFCPDRFKWRGRREKIAPVQSVDIGKVAEYLVAFANEASRDPAAPRQYRVISGEAETCTVPSVQFDNLP